MSQNFENAIRERFEQGFKNWNNGYDAWLDWCETLYEPDAHYNVYSDRLTLQQYKDMMGQLFQAYDIELGEFHNMIVEGEWGATAMSYISSTNAPENGLSRKQWSSSNLKRIPNRLGYASLKVGHCPTNRCPPTNNKTFTASR